jgi:hypothetical protein
MDLRHDTAVWRLQDQNDAKFTFSDPDFIHNVVKYLINP